MVVPVRTWIYDLSASIAGASKTARYRNALFRWHQNIIGVLPANLSGAWTCVDSCNGAGGGASFGVAPSKWLTSANIIGNVEGSNHSWIQWQSPVGMVPGGSIYMVWNCIDSTYNSWEVWTSTNQFTGGTATARPTAVGEVQSNASAGTTFIDDNSACNSHCLRTSIGEFMLLNSINGSNKVRTALCGWRPDGGEPGLSFPFVIFSAHLAAAGVFDWAAGWLGSSAGLTSFTEAGIANGAGVRLVSIAENMASWAGGISNGSPGRAADGFIDAVVNSLGANMYVGRLIDVRGAPDALPVNSDQQGDSGTFKRISLNGLWVPLPTPYSLSL